MNKELFRQIKRARSTLTLTIIFGVLGAVAMIAQMAFLSRIVDRVFLAHENLAQVSHFLFLLLSVIVVRAGFVWAREVSAQQGRSEERRVGKECVCRGVGWYCQKREEK